MEVKGHSQSKNQSLAQGIVSLHQDLCWAGRFGTLRLKMECLVGIDHLLLMKPVSWDWFS